MKFENNIENSCKKSTNDHPQILHAPLQWFCIHHEYNNSMILPPSAWNTNITRINEQFCFTNTNPNKNTIDSNIHEPFQADFIQPERLMDVGVEVVVLS